MADFHDTTRNEVNPLLSQTSSSDFTLRVRPVGTFSPMPLKFGLEIEYLFIKPKSIDNASDRHRLYTEHPTHDADTLGNITAQMFPESDEDILHNRALHQAGFLIKERTGKNLLRFPYPPVGIRYDTWHVTSEQFADLKADQFDKLSQWTGGRVSTSTMSQYQFMGQELVSRILDVPDLNTRLASISPDMTEVRQFVEALIYKPADGCFFISEIENAGLHIHIGLPPSQTLDATGSHMTDTPQAFDLKFLQHLAYIIIEYEHIISLLHNPRRRGFYRTKTRGVAESNRYGILGERHPCGIYPLPVLRNIQETIFGQNMTLLGLAQLMSWDSNRNGATRSKFVNWHNLMDFRRKQTVEFRQHQGTLNADDVEQWIIFVVSLVRAAERKANQTTPTVSPSSPTAELTLNLQWSMRQGRKYCTRFEGEEVMMEKLFDLLQLKNRQKTYWRNKVSQFKGAQHVEHNWYQACDACHWAEDNSNLFVIIDVSVHHVLQAEADVLQSKQDLTDLQAQVEADTAFQGDIAGRIASAKRELIAASRELKETRQRAVSLLNLRRDNIRTRRRTSAVRLHPDGPFIPESDIDFSNAPQDYNLLQIIRDRASDPNSLCNGPTLTSRIDPAERIRISTVVAGADPTQTKYGLQNYRGTLKRRRIIEDARIADRGPEVIDLTHSGPSEEAEDSEQQEADDVEIIDLTYSSSASSEDNGEGPTRKRRR